MTNPTLNQPTAGLPLLRALVETRSPSGNERRAVDLLVRWLNEHGFAAHRDAAGNALGVMQGNGGGGAEEQGSRGAGAEERGSRGVSSNELPASSFQQPAADTRELLLLGHIDTVRGFPTVAERAGKLYGRGAVDAKGPLAAFAVAAALVGPRPGWRIVVAGAVEEEAATSKGARYLAKRRRPDMVIIGEPTGWQRMTLGYKGRLLADVEFQRMISHTAGPATSAPEMAFAYWQRVHALAEGINAGQEKLWDQLQPSLRQFASSDDGILEIAELRLGFRLPPSLTPAALQTLLIQADGHGSFRFTGAEVAYRAEKNTPLVRAFVAAVRARGGQPGFLLKTGTSDMNVVGPVWGCPILAYGPGDSSLDHTPQEHVEIAEWLRGVEVLADAIRRVTTAAPAGG
jgi:LysW-gamma-L-lysine carboxypeptidase